MKLKLALFKHKHGFIHAVNDVGGCYEDDPDYVRITEYIEVDFPELPKDEIVSKQVENLDKEIESTKEEAMKKVAMLQQKKQELLAITHEVNNGKQ